MESIKLLQFRAAYNLPVHVGIETKIFKQHGIELEIAYTPSASYTTQALKEGLCDIGHTGADDVIAAVEANDEAELFLFMGIHSGLFSLIAAPGFSSIDSLRGKPIGVDAKTSGFALVMERLLRARGFVRDDYRPVEIGGWESRYRALMAREIAATLLTEPFVGDVLRCGGHLMATASEMIPTYLGTCGATSRSWAAQHRDRLIRYIRAYVTATQWCFEAKNRPACLDMLARHNEIKGPAAEHTLDTLLDPEQGLYPKAAPNISGVKAALEVRSEMGYLARPLAPVEKYVDLGYYEKALSNSNMASQI